VGVFERRIRVSGLDRDAWRELDAIIDTGSDHCQIPRDVAEDIATSLAFRTTVLLASNREVPVEVVSIVLQFDEYEFATTAYVGSTGGPALVGSLALGQMGLGVDPHGERLIHKLAHLLPITRWPIA